MSYTLRERKDVNYNTKLPLPRATRTRKDEKIYPIEIVESKDDDVLIHYVGYDAKYDEWRTKDDVIQPANKAKVDVYRPFNLYHELSYQIKLALDSKRRKEPEVRIEMAFDKLLFDGGLKQQGVYQGYLHGHEVYSIRDYSTLDCLLCEGWWYRCLNRHLNFCYVNEKTVRFYIHKRASVGEYNPEKGEMDELSGGNLLVFKFVRMDGLAKEWSRITGRQ